MPKGLVYPKEVTHQEARRLAEPAVLATIVSCILLILSGLGRVLTGQVNYQPIILGFIGIVYALVLFYVIMSSPMRLLFYKWPILIAQLISVSAGMYLLSGELRVFSLIIMIQVAVVMLIIWDRSITYLFIFLSGCAYLLITLGRVPLAEIINQSGFFLLAVIIVETVERMYDSNQMRVVRLKAINEFARHVSMSLDVQEVTNLIGAAIKNALHADTYFFGLMEDGQLVMKLIFDDGEFYPTASVSLEGSLSGWVIRNQESLFIADLRNDLNLEGVQTVLMGKKKDSLCWMGVPLHALHVDGIIAVASYDPNDFNRTDLELLENLAQHAALVLDNAYHHAEVQSQARLDSLTGVYNHGHIVKVLNEDAQKCIEKKLPLSLIMLDIDYFKQYNDDYGHVVGDQVLTILTQSIRQHIKSTDSIGRWGGEEFTVVLPGTSSLQAQQVASRIQETVTSLTLSDRDGKLLPFPTVSQGLAIYPVEAVDVFKLIDLADQRLYTAKIRGRNQIEPKQGQWSGNNE